MMHNTLSTEVSDHICSEETTFQHFQGSGGGGQVLPAHAWRRPWPVLIASFCSWSGYGVRLAWLGYLLLMNLMLCDFYAG